LRALLVRELKSHWRVGGGALTGVMFFLAVVTIFPFAVGPDSKTLATLAPAILWIGALLASLLGLERLFAADREDGSLDLIAMQSKPMVFVVLVKALAHWTVSGLPLVLSSPLFGIMLNMPSFAIAVTALTLLVGTPAIAFLGATGAAVTVKLARGSVLIAVLILPLVIPVLVFAMSAIQGALEDPAPFLPPFLLLCSMTLLSAVIGPLAAAIMLRHSAE